MTLTRWNAHCTFPGLLNVWMIKIKEDAWINKWQGNCDWAPFKSIVWNQPLWKSRTIVPSTPTQQHTMAAVWGPKPERERKRSRSAQAFIQIQHFRGSFHWEAVCRKHISRESHLKSWCDCYDWWLLWLCVVYNHNSRDRMSVCNFSARSHSLRQIFLDKKKRG